MLPPTFAPTLPSTTEDAPRQLAEALVEAALAINSSLDIDQVLDQILEQTVRVIPCRSANIMLVEDNDARIVRHLERLKSGKVRVSAKDKSLPLTTPALRQMMLTGRPLLIADTAQVPTWITLAETSWIRSYAAAPLLVCGKTIGFLNINGDRANGLNPHSAERLLAFAAIAAAAIRNAQLYQSLQQHNQNLEARVRQRTTELSAAKERIEAILASVPDAVFVLDYESNLLEINAAGNSLWEQAETAGAFLFDPPFLRRLKGRRVPDEYTVLPIQGRSYQALASPLPIQGQPDGLVIVFRDVTRFQELDELKSHFVSDVSHELRTPLTNLAIYLDLLACTEDPEKQDSFLSTLQRETKRLTHLIEDLLTISRLETGRFHVRLEPVALGLIVTDLVADRTSMATERNLSLTWSVDPELPYIQADPRLLVQILSNLLTNSFNYTLPGGSVHVRTGMQKSHEGEWVFISVADSGVGVDPEELPQIFNRFYRGAACSRTGATGTGIGLAISKELAECMNGCITVQSLPDQGSTFTLWLPAVL